MNRFIYVFVAALFIMGCKKNETKLQTETQQQAEVKSPYPDVVVGIVSAKGAELQNGSLIMAEWQKKAAAQGVTITDMQVVKGQSKDDGTVFYMLLAKTKEGTQFATVLVEKNGQLFFAEQGVITSCRNKSGAEFSIGGIGLDGNIRLYCADCEKCEKTESDL